MIDADIRALQVKMLTEDHLHLLHRTEEDRRSRMDSQSITALCKLQPIKKHYGVPERKRGALFSWATIVRQVLGRFVRERGLSQDMDNIDTLHAFDTAVWNSDLDFHWRTTTPAKKARDWFAS